MSKKQIAWHAFQFAFPPTLPNILTGASSPPKRFPATSYVQKTQIMKRRLPSLNGLRSFEAAARLGRMTAAADELAVTPGAISRQVRQLETSLNVQLFEGPKNNPRLTAAGTALLQPLTEAFDQIESAVRSIAGSDNGTLDVLCFNTFMVKWLLPRLHQFNQLFPDIEIRLSPADRTPAAEQGRYDLVITVDKEADANLPSAIPLFPEWLGPVLAPSLARKIRVRKAIDLTHAPFLYAQTRMNAWEMWCAAEKCDLPAPDGQQFGHLYFVLEAAVGGLGICIAPWHLVMADLHAGRLLAPLGFRESGYRYVMVQPKQKRNRKLDRFCEWLQAQAGEMPRP